MGQLAVFIFDFMSFVNDDVMPFDFFEIAKANSNPLKARHYHIKFFRNHTIDQNFLSFLLCGDQFDDVAVREPFLKLIFPIS